MSTNTFIFTFLATLLVASPVRCQFFLDYDLPPESDLGFRSNPQSFPSFANSPQSFGLNTGRTFGSASPQNFGSASPQSFAGPNGPEIRFEVVAGDPANPSVTRVSSFQYPNDERPNSAQPGLGPQSNALTNSFGNSLDSFRPTSRPQSPPQSGSLANSFANSLESLRPTSRPDFSGQAQPRPQSAPNTGNAFDFEARLREIAASRPQSLPPSPSPFDQNRPPIFASNRPEFDENLLANGLGPFNPQVGPQSFVPPTRPPVLTQPQPRPQRRPQDRPQFVGLPREPSRPSRPAFEPSFFGFGGQPRGPQSENDLLITLYGLEANRSAPLIGNPFRPTLPPSRPPLIGPGAQGLPNTGSPFEFDFPLLSRFAHENNIQVHGHANPLHNLRLVQPPSSNVIRPPPPSLGGGQPQSVNSSSLTALKDHLLAQQFARLQSGGSTPPPPRPSFEGPLVNELRPPTTERPRENVPSYYQPSPIRGPTSPPRNSIAENYLELSRPQIRPQVRPPQVYRPVPVRATVRPTSRPIEATTRRPAFPEDANPGSRNVLDEDSVIASYGNPYSYFPDLARIPKGNRSGSVPPVAQPRPVPRPTSGPVEQPPRFIQPVTPPPQTLPPRVYQPVTVRFVPEITTSSPSIVEYSDEKEDETPPASVPQYGRFRPANINRLPTPENRRAVVSFPVQPQRQPLPQREPQPVLQRQPQPQREPQPVFQRQPVRQRDPQSVPQRQAELERQAQLQRQQLSARQQLSQRQPTIQPQPQPQSIPYVTAPPGSESPQRPTARPRPSYEYRLRRPKKPTTPLPNSLESNVDVNPSEEAFARPISRGPQQPPSPSNDPNSINFVPPTTPTPLPGERPQAVRNFLQSNDFRRNVLPNVGPNVRVVAVRRPRQNATGNDPGTLRTSATRSGNPGRPFRVAYRPQVIGSPITPSSPDQSDPSLAPPTNRPQVTFNSSNVPVGGLPADSDGDGIPGTAGKDYPTLVTIPKTSFSCANKPTNGYYADTEAFCQVVHLCQFGGTQDSFLCPNGTIFNQQRFSCQRWFEVDCASAPKYYGLNDNFSREGNNANELARNDRGRARRDRN